MKTIIKDYAAEATRLIMRGYTAREVSSMDIYSTVHAALTMLMEHACQGDRPMIDNPARDGMIAASADVDRLRAINAVLVAALIGVQTSGANHARNNPGRDVAIAWSAWTDVLAALAKARGERGE